MVARLRTVLNVRPVPVHRLVPRAISALVLCRPGRHRDVRSGTGSPRSVRSTVTCWVCTVTGCCKCPVGEELPLRADTVAGLRGPCRPGPRRARPPARLWASLVVAVYAV